MFGHFESNGSRDIDYVKPADVASAMVDAGRSKLALPPVDLVIRGGLAGGILAAATSLAITGAVQTNQPLVGALIFPVGLILIVLLGLDLVTGAFALVPLPWIENDARGTTMLANWGWIFLGNLIGSVVYGGLLAITLTNFGATAPAGGPRATRRTAMPAGSRCSSRLCSVTGWSAWPSLPP
jgi:formate transporter